MSDSKRCPCCKKTKDVLVHFGLREVPAGSGNMYAQSYCLKCRGLSVNAAHLKLAETETDVENLRVLFKHHYPENDQKYGIETMRKRLISKLSGQNG